MKTHRFRRGAAITAATALAFGIGLPAQADNGTNTSALRDAVTAENIFGHLQALQDVADANGGNRAAGTPGYEASAQYIEAQLRSAGYAPVRQSFSYERFVLNSAEFEQVAPTPTDYTEEQDFLGMDYSGSDDVIAPVTAVDINLTGDRASTSGCETADFAGFPAGNIALIQRGTCDFALKVSNAAAAGAVGVVLFNQGNGGTADRLDLFGGTLGTLQDIPAVTTSFDLGAELAGTDGLEVRIAVDAEIVQTETFNILADTAGRADRTVVVGAHLDSVPEGPGINDNGSGSAAILETALQIAASGDEPRNRVRFAFWGGEEDGLLGSEHYVSKLTKKDIKNHALNLNFDMVGSPNAVRFVYDGDGDPLGLAGPNGSANIERIFEDYFASQGLATEPTDFDGRSDYFAFINNGIPAGGLFTGAEGEKTAEQAAIYGGTVGAPFDPCYHQACDTVDNVDPVVLEQMADAIAHATLTFAETTSAVNGTAKGNGKGSGNGKMEFKGHQAIR
ncbi:M20/M25/M40 family metallo-hydrolase [Arthrobacter sp. NPDC089319]|uniref:M20/M25/M40 family metallo-hydrolase n=1 Tax=Arthrobacter sp. NPDC089319 TaxID=3155915 RepID=UPI0034226399